MRITHIIKKVCICLSIISVIISMNGVSLTAQSLKADTYYKVLEEYENKKNAGIEVYELLDEEGRFFGYYEPYSDTNPKPSPTRYTSNIDWTVASGTYRYGVNQYTLSSGHTLDITVAQSVSGTSYLTFYNHNTNSSLRFTNTMTNNGWNGVVTFSGISTAVYSFGIENASSVDNIRYTGSYTL